MGVSGVNIQMRQFPWKNMLTFFFDSKKADENRRGKEDTLVYARMANRELACLR